VVVRHGEDKAWQCIEYQRVVLHPALLHYLSFLLFNYQITLSIGRLPDTGIYKLLGITER
jgi:hypothetical protein